MYVVTLQSEARYSVAVLPDEEISMKTLGRVDAATGLLFAATAQAHTFGAKGGALMLGVL